MPAYASVIYIGQADHGWLRLRIGDYEKGDRSAKTGHGGDRLIRQLADAADVLIAWRGAADMDPLTEEMRLIAAFRAAYGKPPFANYPNRVGK